MELTFNDVRSKDFVNIFDGKILGRADDIVFDQTNSSIKGFSVPLPKKGFGFKKSEIIFVGIKNIVKIGEDVILVELKPKQDFFEKENSYTPKIFKVINRSSNDVTNKLQEIN